MIRSLHLIFQKCKINMSYYAVAKGRHPGIYDNWAECQAQISGFKYAVFKKFTTLAEAQEFVEIRSSCIIDKRGTPQKTKMDNIKTSPELILVPPDKERLSPTLVTIKTQIKNLQKEISELRWKFDCYVKTKSKSTPEKLDSQQNCLPTSSEEPIASAYTSDRKRRKRNSEDFSFSGFNMNSMGFVVVYTDGACHSNGRKGAKAGIGVYFGKDHPMNISEPIKGRPTNNNAEIQAAIVALKKAKEAGFTKVQINTDSQFMINCMTSWIRTWKKNGWKKCNGSSVLNKVELMELDEICDGLIVKWNHVRGHSGEEGNEMADKLANAGAERYISSDSDFVFHI